MGQEKKPADYTSGTYFIHPGLIEEMRQLQRQKHQIAKEQGGMSPEQQQYLTPHYVPGSGNLSGEQVIPMAPDLTGTQNVHTNIGHIQPPPN